VTRFDAVVVGSGPNGLAAAITLLRAGRSVCLLEAAETVGGGLRSGPATLPGFVHDECSAVHPLALSSPLFRSLPLARHGLEWRQPAVPAAHPFLDGSAALLTRDLEAVPRQFPIDGDAYRRLFAPLVSRWRELAWEVLQPITHLPRHPLLLARFGLPSLLSAQTLVRRQFRDPRLQALVAGCAGHAILPLDAPLTASFGLLLAGSAHAVGWPVARGGSQALADALHGYFLELGGELRVATPVRSPADLPEHRVALFDLAPERLLEVCAGRLSRGFRRAVRSFKRGEAVFKVDFALSGPIPWTAKECRSAGTLHLGGDLDEMVESEGAVAAGRIPEQPFVLVSQPTIVDPSRAPAGKHVAWAYCHLPRGADVDLTESVERRIEAFAPGFRDLILARAATTPGQMEARNPNLVGGDIAGGSNGGLQLFFRPGKSLHPYHAGEGIYLCSASTPPGGGVHGMCGYWAARAALKRELR
jgi:phytoene dehydrogenase-like protein